MEKTKQKTRFEIAVMELVKEKREAKKLSQASIGDILGVTKGFIGQIEIPENPSTYSLDQLNHLAFVLKCSPTDFIPKKAIEETGWKKS